MRLVRYVPIVGFVLAALRHHRAMVRVEAYHRRGERAPADVFAASWVASAATFTPLFITVGFLLGVAATTSLWVPVLIRWGVFR